MTSRFRPLEQRPTKEKETRIGKRQGSDRVGETADGTTLNEESTEVPDRFPVLWINRSLLL